MSVLIKLAPDLATKKKQLLDAIPLLTEQGVDFLQDAITAASSVAFEEHYICKDYRNLYSNYFSKKYRDIRRDCMRIHFFTGQVDSVHGKVDLPALREQYIGYSVIRPLSGKRCVGRTVLDPVKLGYTPEKHLYCLRTKFRVHLYGFELVVTGFPFCTQDGEANTCSHTAMWALCRYMSERYPKYRELYPYDFVTLSDSRFGRTVPYNGLTWSAYCEILSDFGCHPELLRQPEDAAAKPEWFQDLYSHVESGFPILASYGGHVVILIGHSMDYKRTPQMFAKSLNFIDSCSFVDAFIVIDDSSAPFQRLSRESNEHNYGKRYAPQPPNGMGREITVDSIVVGVCPLPEKVFLPAAAARKFFVYLLEELTSKKVLANDGTEVVRMFVTTASALKQHAFERNLATPHPAFGTLIGLPLPHFVWVLEIATTQGYKQRECIGELIIDATGREDELASFLYARINGLFTKEESGAKVFKEAPITPQKQFIHNLGGPTVTHK